MCSGEGLINEIGREDTDSDGQLVGGNEAASLVGRREFGGIDRRSDSRNAHSQTDKKPPHHEDGHTGGKGLNQGTNHKEDGGQNQGPLPSESVCDGTAHERAEQRTLKLSF